MREPIAPSSNLPFDRYRARIAERIKDLPDGADYPASVFATFSLAMDKAAATCPEAETLMGIAAFLAPDRIPLDIITADVIGEDEAEQGGSRALQRLADYPRNAGRRLARRSACIGSFRRSCGAASAAAG